jgi:hypothetical protein
MRKKYPWIAAEYNWLAEDYEQHSCCHDCFSDWDVNDFARSNFMGKEMSEVAKAFIHECQQEWDDAVDAVL